MRNRWIAFALTALLSAASLTAQDYRRPPEARLHPQPAQGSMVEEVLYRDLLRVGVGLFEPWVMCGEGGDLIGYEIDVARRLASDMGVRVQFVPTNWYYIIPALIERDFDLIISGMGITPERGLHVNFSVPYSEFGTVIVANASRTQGLATLADFDSASVTFGARAGTVPEQATISRFPKASLRTFGADEALLQALLNGEIHAAAADQIKGARWLEAHPEALRRPFDELFSKVPEAIALRKGDADSLNFLNGWITHYQVGGWLTERRQYWFETRDWSGLVATDPNVVAQCSESFEREP